MIALKFRRYGFTIIELMVAMGIYGIIMYAFYSMFAVTNIAWEHGSAKIYAAEESKKAFDAMSRELMAANYLSVTLSNATTISYYYQPTWNSTTAYREITFQEPVDYDNDGDTVDGKGYAEWGAIDNSGGNRLGCTVKFMLQSIVGGNNNLIRRVYDIYGNQVGADRVIATNIRTFDGTSPLWFRNDYPYANPPAPSTCVMISVTSGIYVSKRAELTNGSRVSNTAGGKITFFHN